MKRISSNLPLILGLSISAAFSCDLPLLDSLKTERTFGWWLVVGVPAAILLILAQLVLWAAYPSTRPWSGRAVRGASKPGRGSGAS